MLEKWIVVVGVAVEDSSDSSEENTDEYSDWATEEDANSEKNDDEDEATDDSTDDSMELATVEEGTGKVDDGGGRQTNLDKKFSRSVPFAIHPSMSVIW